MKITCIGGGPAGLYLAILVKLRSPAAEVAVYERNRPDDTFGFGVVFSDATVDNLADADPPTLAALRGSLHHWDDIAVHRGAERLTSTGHGFAGLSRQRLLDVLQRRARELGVALHFEVDVTDPTPLLDADLLVVADGVNSALRARWADRFVPHVEPRPNRFVWLGTTFPYDAFTFYFDENEHGLFRVHAYRYEAARSTFIVECTEDTWRRAGLDQASEAETVAYMERLFAPRLAGHRLLANRSLWRAFPNIHVDHWGFTLERPGGGTAGVVLLGDAAHTAHFSIGSGTKLAMEDAIVLSEALFDCADVAQALARYEERRRPGVLSTQRAAQVSLEWFERTERYMALPPLQFLTSLLTRSLRITHENLRERDPALIGAVDAWVAERAGEQVAGGAVVRWAGPEARPARAAEAGAALPPMFTPYRLGTLGLRNRVVVSPMCQYSATDGAVDDWHLVHLGSRALGGAALVIAEMCDVSAEGRITPGCAGLYRDAHTAAWRRIVDFVHRESAAAIGIQLGHAGRKGACSVPWEGDRPLAEGGWPLLAASALPYTPGGPVPRAMDEADLRATTEDYVAATRRAAEAGFDLLEIHMAHGYLLAGFLSPLTNRRTDRWGGGVEGRLRFPLAVLDAVRAAWPRERPLSVRISATDWAEGGLDPEDLLVIARALHAHGADILDVSTGQTDRASRPRYGRLYQTPFAELIRLETGVPTMTVGAITSHADVNSVIAAGRADLCVLARAHLWDPSWTRHAATEQGVELDWPVQYRSVQRWVPRLR